LKEVLRKKYIFFCVKIWYKKTRKISREYNKAKNVGLRLLESSYIYTNGIKIVFGKSQNYIAYEKNTTFFYYDNILF